MPLKYKGPGCLKISYMIGQYNINKALLDLGASLNLLPHTIYNQLSLNELKRTLDTLQLANRSVRHPKK